MEPWQAEGSDPRVGDSLVFDALRERFVTSNGNGWRHELKIKQDQRVAMTAAYEELSATLTAELSDGSKTIVAQHHADGTGTIVKLYIADTSEGGLLDSQAKNGVFDVYVRMARSDGSGEAKYALGTIRSGDSFRFSMINDYGTVTMSAFGQRFELEVEDSSKSFLKFGNYLQAQDAETGEDVDDSGDWASFYSDAGITTSVLTFSDVTHIRQVS